MRSSLLFSLLIFIFMFSAGILFSLTTHAALKDDCKFFYTKTGALDIYRQFENPASCYISINPEVQFSMVYRSYSIGHDGMFMVFNSYGPGNDDQTGARVFYLFPRKLIPSLNNLGKNPEVTMANSNAVIEFDRKSGKILQFSGGQMKESAELNDKNKGGVEIPKYNGLLIDSGFAKAHDVRENQAGKTLARDSAGRLCELKNTEFYTYENQNVNLKFKTDVAVKEFLKTRCPELVLNF